MTLSYYDRIIAGITVSMAAGAMIGISTQVPLNVATMAGSLAAGGFMYDGMFRNAPV